MGDTNIASPVIVFNKKEQVSTALNLTDLQLEYIQKKVYEVEKLDLFGTIRFKSQLKDLKKICNKLTIDYIENNIVQALSAFPKLIDVISQYQQIPFLTCEYHFDVFHYNWKNIGKQFRVGIHKFTKNAQQYFFRLNKEVWLKIPGYAINPDSRFICESYQALLEKKPFIFYNPIEKRLTIQTISIPILIERMLRVPSLHKDRRIFKNYKEQVFENISVSDFKQLNRIFSNGVKIL